MAPSSHSDNSEFLPLQLCIGTYDGAVAGLSVTTDESSALTLTTHFATDAHISAVRSAAVRGKFAATGGEDEVVRLYDVAARVEIGTLFQHQGTITSLNFVDDHGKQLLFSSSADSSICIWRVAEWRLLKRLVAHQSAVNDVAVHPSATVALSVASDRSLFMWNLARGKVCFSAKTKGNPASTVLWSPSGDHYTLVAGKSVTVSSVDGKDVHTFIHQADARCAAFIDNNRLATGADDRTVRVWDVRSKAANHEIIYQHSARVNNLYYQSGLLLSSDSGGGLVIWDPKMPSSPRIETNVSVNARITCMAAGLKNWQRSHHNVISSKQGHQSELGEAQKKEKFSATKSNEKNGEDQNAPEDDVDTNANINPDTEQSVQLPKKQKISGSKRLDSQKQKPNLEGTASQRKRKKRKMNSK